MGLRSFLVKTLSMLDYFSNIEDIESQSEIKYNNTHHNNMSYSHSPQYHEDNDSEIYVFDSLELFVEFMNDTTGFFPQHEDIGRCRVISTSFTTGTDGNNYIVATTLQCACNFCTARPVLNKYYDYNVKHYQKMEVLGFKTMSYAQY